MGADFPRPDFGIVKHGKCGGYSHPLGSSIARFAEQRAEGALYQQRARGPDAFRHPADVHHADGGDPTFFRAASYQTDGPVTGGSGGDQEQCVDFFALQPLGDAGSVGRHESSRDRDVAHEGECVAAIEPMAPSATRSRQSGNGKSVLISRLAISLS